jgi:hypothetical protein
VQLLLNIVVQTHFLHGLDIAGPEPESNAVEDMNNFVAVRGAA